MTTRDEGTVGFEARRPIDDAERDAARLPKVALCCVEGDPGFRCTRTLGHMGDHVASGTGGMIVARWPSRAFTAVFL